MANVKKTSSLRRTTGSSATARRKTTSGTRRVSRPVRRVVDPMMVSPVKARYDDARLTSAAIDNDVDFTETDDDDSFISDKALYNIELFVTASM